MSSPRLNVTLTEIRDEWSMIDLLDAHVTLDLMDDLESRAAKQSRPRKGGR